MKKYIVTLFVVIMLLTANKSFAADYMQACNGHFWGYIKSLTVGSWGEKNAGIVLYNTQGSGDSDWLFNNKTIDTPEGRAMLSLEELAYSSGAMVSAFCENGKLTSVYIQPDDYNGQ